MDIYFRNAIISVLDILNKNISIEQVEKGVSKAYSVPFYYHMANDEQFMKDFFIDYPGDCKVVATAEGNYDMAPKGEIKMDSFVVKPENLTNKFVRGTFKREELDSNSQKILNAYSAYLFVLPMTLSFSSELFADNLNQALKLTQEMLTTFYKNNVVYFQFRGIRIPGHVSFADDADIEKKFEFTYEDNQKVRTKHAISMETYFPIFDDTTIRHKGSIIREFKKVMESRMSNENRGMSNDGVLGGGGRSMPDGPPGVYTTKE